MFFIAFSNNGYSQKLRSLYGIIEYYRSNYHYNIIYNPKEIKDIGFTKTCKKNLSREELVCFFQQQGYKTISQDKYIIIKSFNRGKINKTAIVKNKDVFVHKTPEPIFLQKEEINRLNPIVLYSLDKARPQPAYLQLVRKPKVISNIDKKTNNVYYGIGLAVNLQPYTTYVMINGEAKNQFLYGFDFYFNTQYKRLLLTTGFESGFLENNTSYSDTRISQIDTLNILTQHNYRSSYQSFTMPLTIGYRFDLSKRLHLELNGGVKIKIFESKKIAYNKIETAHNFISNKFISTTVSYPLLNDSTKINSISAVNYLFNVNLVYQMHNSNYIFCCLNYNSDQRSFFIFQKNKLIYTIGYRYVFDNKKVKRIK